MDEFKFYHRVEKDFIYNAKINEFEGKELFIVMWKEDGEMDSVIYPKEEVYDLIARKIWILVD